MKCACVECDIYYLQDYPWNSKFHEYLLFLLRYLSFDVTNHRSIFQKDLKSKRILKNSHRYLPARRMFVSPLLNKGYLLFLNFEKQKRCQPSVNRVSPLRTQNFQFWSFNEHVPAPCSWNHRACLPYLEPHNDLLFLNGSFENRLLTEKMLIIKLPIRSCW